MAHLNAAGITRLVTKLKDRFAALAHTHAAATDITGQLPVASGGTGASTASGARTNLDAAQDDSSGITLASAASNISTLLATTGIASTPSGKTLQGQISTLQDSVSSLMPTSYTTTGLTPSGCTFDRGGYFRVGKVVFVNIRITPSTNRASVSGFPRPYATVAFGGYLTSNEEPGFGYMDTTGTLRIPDVLGTKIAMFSFTYLSM